MIKRIVLVLFLLASFNLMAQTVIVHQKISGYLTVGVKDVGEFTFEQLEQTIENINSESPEGYNDWRLPTFAELRSMYTARVALKTIARSYLASDGYVDFAAGIAYGSGGTKELPEGWKLKKFQIRLVTTGIPINQKLKDVIAEKEKLILTCADEKEKLEQNLTRTRERRDTEREAKEKAIAEKNDIQKEKEYLQKEKETISVEAQRLAMLEKELNKEILNLRKEKEQLNVDLIREGKLVQSLNQEVGTLKSDLKDCQNRVSKLINGY